MALRFRHQIVGRPVVDAHGIPIGFVSDTWPSDGGGEPELALIKMRTGRFARDKYIPVDALTELNGHLFAAYSRHTVDDAPDADNYGWGDPGTLAKSHWTTVAEVSLPD